MRSSVPSDTLWRVRENLVKYKIFDTPNDSLSQEQVVVILWSQQSVRVPICLL